MGPHLQSASWVSFPKRGSTHTLQQHATLPACARGQQVHQETPVSRRKEEHVLSKDVHVTDMLVPGGRGLSGETGAETSL